jgi:hypothetical protein
MKSAMKSFVLIAFIAFLWSVYPQKVAAQNVAVSFQLFYDQLSPYGTWVDYPKYGYVWIPNVGRQFIPYSSKGHWVYSDYGWTWVSDYPWGWAPFHYGRWFSDPVYGWFWVPDTEWGPAWVTWRHSNGYYGWAPMAPGISISLSFGSGYHVPDDHWIFVREHDFGRDHIDKYRVNSRENITIIRNSTIIENTYVEKGRKTTFIAGPRRDEVQKFYGRPIRPVIIQEYGKPGQSFSNNKLQLYMPQVHHDPNARIGRPVPQRVTNLKEVTPLSSRKSGSNVTNPAPSRSNSAGQSIRPQRGNVPVGREREGERIQNDPEPKRIEKEKGSVNQRSKPIPMKPEKSNNEGKRGHRENLTNNTTESSNKIEKPQPIKPERNYIPSKAIRRLF